MQAFKLIRVFDGVTIDQDRTSTEVLIDIIYGASIYVSTTGGTGTLRVQASVNGTDWFDIDTGAVSGATTLDFNKTDLMYRNLRLFYDFTGSTGSITADIFVKG